jgi:hypothetical protein
MKKEQRKIGHVLHVLKKSSERDRAREEIFTLVQNIIFLTVHFFTLLCPHRPAT